MGCLDHQACPLGVGAGAELRVLYLASVWCLRHQTPLLGLSVAPGLRIQWTSSVLSTTSLPRGPAGKGHQLFCPWPGALGQALGSVLCGSDPQATATLPKRLTLYVS